MGQRGAASVENGFNPAFATSESDPAAELEFDGGVTTSTLAARHGSIPGSPS